MKGLQLMRKQKIYIETTLFNFYFDIDREAHADTVTLFEDIAIGKYEAFTSDYVINELEETQGDKREKMLSLVEQYGIIVLMLNNEAERLADIYVEQNILPLKYRTDGVHIAVAAVNDLDMIISMNFQHIVKRKTKIGTGNINALNGYRAVEIYTPMEVNENETD
jgi:predicted nucleic acid-binding protein